MASNTHVGRVLVHRDRAAGRRTPRRTFMGGTLPVRGAARGPGSPRGSAPRTRPAPARRAAPAPRAGGSSRVTGSPTAARSRRTSRLRPSVITSCTAPLPAEAATILAATRPAPVRRRAIDARADRRQVLGRGRALDLGEVFLLHPVARMQDPVREVAVVREQEQAFAVPIETADREHPWAVRRHQGPHVGASLRVAHRRDDPDRLVDARSTSSLGSRFTVRPSTAHHGAAGSTLSPRVGDGPVDGDPSLARSAPHTLAGNRTLRAPGSAGPVPRLTSGRVVRRREARRR